MTKITTRANNKQTQTNKQTNKQNNQTIKQTNKQNKTKQNKTNEQTTHIPSKLTAVADSQIGFLRHKQLVRVRLIHAHWIPIVGLRFLL